MQGAFDLHRRMLHRLDVSSIEVRTAAELDDVDALVLPGGESGTMSMLLERNELFEPISKRLNAGMPALGTCAGAILLGRDVIDGRADQRSFGSLDLVIRRNGYGRQIDSFEGAISLLGDDEPFAATFIRAPVIENVGPDIDVLAEFDGDPVVVAGRTIVACTFHPELGVDTRIHERFLNLVR